MSAPLMVAKYRAEGQSESDITWHMLQRAAVVALLDLTVCDWLWSLADPIGPYTHVLLGLSLSLAALSVLRLLPVWAFATLTLVIVALYQVWLPQMVDAWSETRHWWIAVLVGFRTPGWPRSPQVTMASPSTSRGVPVDETAQHAGTRWHIAMRRLWQCGWWLTPELPNHLSDGAVWPIIDP